MSALRRRSLNSAVPVPVNRHRTAIPLMTTSMIGIDLHAVECSCGIRSPWFSSPMYADAWHKEHEHDADREDWLRR